MSDPPVITPDVDAVVNGIRRRQATPPTPTSPSVTPPTVTPPTISPPSQPPTLSLTPAATPTMPRQFAGLGDFSWTGDPSFARPPPATTDPGFVIQPRDGTVTDPGLNRLENLPQYYQQYGNQWGVPPNILKGVAGVETSFGTNISTSSAGAKGLMQFVDETATKYGVNVNDFRSSVEGAAHYLHDLYRQYGNWPQALQAYNGALNDPSMSYARKVLGYAGQTLPPQRYVFAADTPDLANRAPDQWGRTPEGGYAENTLPQPSDIAGVMALGRKMMPFASGNSVYDQIAMLNFYGSYVKSYQTNQINQMKLAEEQYKLRLEQHQQRLEEETQAYGDAVAANTGNPNKMLSDVADLALKYDDKPMSVAVLNGPDAVNTLMQRRDAYYSDLTKTSAAQQNAREKQQEDKQIEDAAQNDLAMWKADPANAGATPQQIQAKLFDFRAARRHELLDKGAKAETATQQRAAKQQDLVDRAVAADMAQYQKDHPDATPEELDQKKLDFYRDRNREVQPGSRGAAARPGTVDAMMEQWLQQHPNAGPEEQAAERGRLEQAAKPKEPSPARPGSIDAAMSDWLKEQTQDPKRWSGGAVGQGAYTAPGPDETMKKRGQFTQEGTKTSQTARAVSQRLMIAANGVAKTVGALAKLPSTTTLGAFGGAQAKLGPDIAENMKKALANKATPLMSQLLATLSNGLGRQLASLEAAGVATGMVGLADSLQREVPAMNDKNENVVLKMAGLRDIADGALEVIANNENLSEKEKEQIAAIQARIDHDIPFTREEVVEKIVNPTTENMIDLARKLGLGGGPRTDGAVVPTPPPPGVTFNFH